jgi:uncharacterized cupin superfamily protein
VKRPIHWSQIPWTVWYAGTDRELRGIPLCDHGGRAEVGVGLLELPPGSCTRPAHYHSHEEEHLFALSGSATLRLGDERFALAAGSYVCFPAGQVVLHHLENDGREPFRYLMIGERNEADRVVHEPANSAMKPPQGCFEGFMGNATPASSKCSGSPSVLPKNSTERPRSVT